MENVFPLSVIFVLFALGQVIKVPEAAGEAAVEEAEEVLLEEP